MTKRQSKPPTTEQPADGAQTEPEPKPRRAKASAAGGRSGAASRRAARRDPEAETVAYLRAHPDFFDRHPDVLAHLRIHHETGGAVSLIEHQVVVLRRQLDTERGRLAHLISRARDYETLSGRLHDLVLHLIPAERLEHLCHVLHDVLLREFNAEAVTLKLFPLAPTAGARARKDPLVASFREFLDRPHALCGPLDPDQGAILFGEAGAGLHSAVLVPIRAGSRAGVLAIGAADRNRFGPDMRTDMLDRLGEIVSVKLLSIPEDTQPTEKPRGRRPARAKAKPVSAVDEAAAAAPPSRRRAKGTRRAASPEAEVKPLAPARSRSRAKKASEPSAQPAAEDGASEGGLQTGSD